MHCILYYIILYLFKIYFIYHIFYNRNKFQNFQQILAKFVQICSNHAGFCMAFLEII